MMPLMANISNDFYHGESGCARENIFEWRLNKNLIHAILKLLEKNGG
jgi:hypothetical protein